MQRYQMPDAVKDRVIRRQGKLFNHDTIDASRTALIVIDMQNHFVAPGFPAEAPAARQIVPAINRLAAAMRAAGGLVVWIQTTASGALDRWGNHHRHTLSADRARTRLASLDEASEGFALFPALQPAASDLRVKKIMYSAFIAGSSDLDAVLRRRGVETVLITGTVTNVCCESSARDAMMLDYRVIMVSDANAALSEDAHAATLNSFAEFFGDVMTCDDVVDRLVAVSAAADG
jgi:ureidoacrylate peracid hydrolase